MPFSYSAADKTYQDLTKPFARALTRALFETDRLRVIDPQRLDSTLIELKLPVGVPLDSSQVALVSKPLKAEVAVYGDIVSVQKTQEKKGNRVTESLEVTVEAKLVLAATAEILSTARGTGSASIRYREDAKPPSELLTNAALNDGAKKIAEQLVLQLTPK